ncbi:hypothetical protein LJC27_07510 [Christensenellaceae bacterium OttesenSCG-928-M15]|nr:hypothetical protein [Christensenellaceae bacterium OttesenSCG-928-M15]
MMDLQKRISIISEIVTEHPKLGKTAMMKYIYLLQKVYKVPFGHDYSIYTYGPYASTVMEDIDYADHMDVIDVERQIYDTGKSGYCITPSKKAKVVIENEADTVQEYALAIEEMLSHFKDKTAKDLELLTTIIYIYSNYSANGWPVEEVLQNVHEIKPHFDITTIRKAYDELNALGILKKAIA